MWARSPTTGRAAVCTALVLTLAGCVDRRPEVVTTLVFDGRTETIEGPVECTIQPGGKLVIFASEGRVRSIRVLLRPKPRLVAEKVSVRYLDANGYVADPGEVDATKIDETYRFTGRMPPNAGETQWHRFEIKTTCPLGPATRPPKPPLDVFGMPAIRGK